MGGWEKTKRDGRGGRLSNVVCGCLIRQFLAHVPESVRQFLAGVVGLDGLCLYDNRRIASRVILAAGRHRPCHVAPRKQGGSRRHCY